MNGRLCPVRSHGLSNSATRVFGGLLCLAYIAATARAQEHREREPNSVYAERRAKLAAQADEPIILWGSPAAKKLPRPTSLPRKRIFTTSPATMKKAPG